MSGGRLRLLVWPGVPVGLFQRDIAMTIWNKSAAILGFAAAMAFAGQALAEDKMARPGTKQQVAAEVSEEEEPTMWAGGSPDFCEACGGEVVDDPELGDPYEGPADDTAAAEDGTALSEAGAATQKSSTARSGHTGNRSSDTLRGATCTQGASTAACGN